MAFFVLSIFAGVLTILAPCILPLLPVILGTADGGSKKKISKRSVTVILTLAVSVFVFTLLLRATTAFISIPQSTWNLISGIVIVLLGIAVLFPTLWNKLFGVKRLYEASNKALGAGYQKNSFWGDVAMGLALGPVFTTCSPTYLFILATVLPAQFGIGFLYLIGFVIGMTFSLFLIAYIGQKVINKISVKQSTTEKIKKIFGILFILVGVIIMTGYDKKISTLILDSGYSATINLEERLIESTQKNMNEEQKKQSSVEIPNFLRNNFPNTDWSMADESVSNILSGGPGKDGIPALTNPKFIPISGWDRPDDVQTIVVSDDSVVKAYPYNILIWHEIVNDTVGGKEIAVTFCPLCGSAIVFDRNFEGEKLEFGVSGGLLESNMVMYDRNTESLWQQSTGEGLAGVNFGKKLNLVEFQLMNVGELKKKYPSAQILSEDTGHSRTYGRNPYSGYEESESFYFSPSITDTRYPSKDIFVIYRVGESTVATPWSVIKNGDTHETTINSTVIILQKEGGELTVTVDGNKIPFYFEMWFSWAVQNQDEGVVYDPSKN